MPIFEILTVVILLAIVAAFYLNKYVARLLLATIHILFPLSILAILLAVFLPAFFDLTADLFLKSVGTYDYIINIDQNTSLLSNPTDQIGGFFDNIFGNNQNIQDDSTDGFILKSVYPGLISLVGLIMRIFTLVIGLLLCIIMIYINIIGSSTAEIQSLNTRIKKLENIN